MEQTENFKVTGGSFQNHKDKQLAEKVSNGFLHPSGSCFGLAYMAHTYSTRSETSEILIIGVFKPYFA
jgi:hypothetical protein